MENRIPFDLIKFLTGRYYPRIGKGLLVQNLTYFPEAKGNYSLAGVVDGELITWTQTGLYTHMTNVDHWNLVLVEVQPEKL